MARSDACVCLRAQSLQSYLTPCDPWTVAHQAPLFYGILSRGEYWNGLPCPPSGDLCNPRIEPTSLMSLALAGRFPTTSATWEGLGSKEGDV